MTTVLLTLRSTLYPLPSKRGLPAGRAGFTLIELIVAITIVSIISSVGFVTYSNSQIIGRDGRRQNDLRSVYTALELYHQKNGRYPCVANNFQASSDNSSGFWITDDGCGGILPVKDFDTNYMNAMPMDPKKNAFTSGNQESADINGYFYSSCNDGVGFTLGTRLENKKDKNNCQNKQNKNPCDSSLICNTETENDMFFLTNQ